MTGTKFWVFKDRFDEDHLPSDDEMTDEYEAESLQEGAILYPTAIVFSIDLGAL